MCGIAGYISLESGITESQLKAATTSMSHRGPDASGYYFSDEKHVGFGHRRLSVLDLSDVAGQPMVSADGRYVMVYNGEVYNFHELKQELSDKGVSLKTGSDTEVILKLFAEQGHRSFSKLNGMFALAIYDKLLNSVTICRDHAGIKPLFLYHDEKQIIFASELKAIKSIIGNLTINRKAIPYFLHLGFIPSPLTIYDKVAKFPAASYLEIDLNRHSFENVNSECIPFWSIAENILPVTKKNEADAKSQLHDLVLDSVEKQMISDVPVGTFLSGGIDSSLVTAMAAKVSSKKVESFSIAIDDGKYNEAQYAQKVAAHIGTNHHEFSVKENEVMELTDKLIPAFDEPFADSSAFPTMMVSRLAREHVTVALSGDGGDELFMGYGMHRWAGILDRRTVRSSRWLVSAASGIMPDRYKRAGKLFAYRDKKNIISHIFSQEQYFFSERELDEVLASPAYNFSSLNVTAGTERELNSKEKQALWDMKYYLQDDLLVKVDRSSMQYSLESRVPLLDHRIIEFAINLDTALKIKGATMKHLLKEVLYDYVPKEMFDRPKWGFSIPLAKWLKTDLNFLLDKYLSKQLIEEYNFVNYNTVIKLRKDYESGATHLYNRLWVMVVLHWWLDENKKGNV